MLGLGFAAPEVDCFVAGFEGGAFVATLCGAAGGAVEVVAPGGVVV